MQRVWSSELRAQNIINPSPLTYARFRSGSSSKGDDAPLWIEHDLAQAQAPRETWARFREKVLSVVGEDRSSKAVDKVVKAATKASFNKKVKSKSVLPFMNALLEGTKIEVECLGRAKSVAAVCFCLDIRIGVMANETHVYVQKESGEILDFETNIKYKDKLAQDAAKSRIPYYYSMVVPLDSRGIVTTTVLNDDTSDEDALRIIDERYPGSRISEAPVWVRVFRYEQKNPQDILSDSEALTHPFVALDFAKKLSQPSLLQVALANLSCGIFEYSKDFFYDNDGDTTFLNTLQDMVSSQSIEHDMARSLLQASRHRAKECMADSESKSYLTRCEVFERVHLPAAPSSGRGKRHRE